MGEVKVKKIDEHLYTRYPTQTNPQPCHIELQGDGTLTAGYCGGVGGGTTMDVFLGQTIQWSILPYLTEDETNDLLEELVPSMERVHAGHTVKWNGSNFVGSLNADAEEAEEEIRLALENEQGTLLVWSPGDWWQNCREDVLETLEKYTNIEEAAGELDELFDASDGGDNGTPFLDGDHVAFLETYMEEEELEYKDGILASTATE